MKKVISIITALVMVLSLGIAAASADEFADYLGTWYMTEYQDLDDYPGTVFRANGVVDWFTVYTDGTSLMINDHVYTDTSASGKNYSCELKDGVLEGGIHSCTLEDGRLIDRMEYGGAVHAVITYSREANERCIAQSISETCRDVLTAADYDGVYDIVKYGMNNAFIDAAEMDLQGTAKIENGKITLNWTRAGVEKSSEIEFGAELNKGRLYIADDHISHIVSLLSDGTVILDVGLYQAQWVMKKQNAVSRETVNRQDPAFEEAFGKETDWYATEESRDRLASLLVDAAVAAGIDPDTLRLDGHNWLGLFQGGEYPLLIVEGKGDCRHYLLHIGRGISAETKEPFVYTQWEYSIATEAAYPGHEYLTDAFNEQFFSMFCGETLWQVAVTPAAV